jgi:hypothetical protein
MICARYHPRRSTLASALALGVVGIVFVSSSVRGQEAEALPSPLGLDQVLEQAIDPMLAAYASGQVPLVSEVDAAQALWERRASSSRRRRRSAGRGRSHRDAMNRRCDSMDGAMTWMGCSMMH